MKSQLLNNGKPNTNIIVKGTNTGVLFVAVDNHADREFINLISLDSGVKNRAERRADIEAQRGYVTVTESVVINPLAF